MKFERLEQWLWRGAILILPLGTVWIFAFGAINGTPWALGNLTLGLGEILLFGAVVATALRSGFETRSRFALCALALIGLLFGRALGTSEILVAIFMILRYALAFAVFAVHQPLANDELRRWWLIGAIAPCAVGIAQALLQIDIVGSTLMGISPHVVAAPGTAVIEIAGERILRAYGTFPHPNVFAAYLVLTTAVVAGSSAKVVRIMLGLVGFALALTFSRAAIIALVVLLIMSREVRERGAWILGGLMIGVLLFLPAYGVRVGAAPGRLEVKSVDQRTQSLKDGWRLFRGNMLGGVGVLQTVPVLASAGGESWAFEPAHAVPMLMLAEWGVIGVLLALPFLTALPLFFAPLLLLDHAFLTSAQLVLLGALAVRILKRPYEHS